MTGKLAMLEKDVQRAQEDGGCRMVKSEPLSSFRQTPGTLGLIPPNEADMVMMGLHSDISINPSISKESNSKACQTYETAFVPCESCDVVQRKMKEAGDIIIKTCIDQGLPSSLKKFKSELTHVEWLSFGDICRWMTEQNKDIARVGKQNDILQQTINPLKSDVKNCKRRTQEAEKKAEVSEKSLMQEKETQGILRKQIEVSDVPLYDSNNNIIYLHCAQFSLDSSVAQCL